MGYEVMDESGRPTMSSDRPAGGAPPRPGSPGSPDEPFDLGELGPSTDELPRQSTTPDDGTTGPTGPPPPGSWPSWLRAVNAHHPHRTVVAGVVATLVVGALAGGFVVHQRTESIAAAKDSSTLAAVAVVENQLVGGRDGVRTATLSVRLRNLGPRTITVQVSPRGSTPSTDHPLVSATADQAVAPAQDDTMVLVEVPLPCDADLPAIALPVRTSDGVLRTLPVEAPSNSEVLNSDRTMCQDGAQSDNPVLNAELGGTLVRPTLRLTNTTDQPRRIWRYLGDEQPNPPVTITFTPALPQVIDAHGSLTLRISVTATRCITDLGKLDSATQDGWITLTDTDPGTDVAPTTIADYIHATGIGLSTLVTTALLAACR